MTTEKDVFLSKLKEVEEFYLRMSVECEEDCYNCWASVTLTDVLGEETNICITDVVENLKLKYLEMVEHKACHNGGTTYD